MYGIVLLSLALSAASSLAVNREKIANFDQFKVAYGKSYVSLNEENYRRDIFNANLEEIRQHNRVSRSYTKGVNMWTDLTQEEWSSQYLGGYKHINTVQQPASQNKRLSPAELPASVDWREKGVITDIKNQGQCGSCWAFASTEQIESYLAIAQDQLHTLSAQQITSCAPNAVNCGGSGGCEGSTPPLAYSYTQLFGLVLDDDYPYISGGTTNTESCMYNYDSMAPVATITGYNNLPPNDQDAIMQHIAEVGPLAISVAASGMSSYHGGVFDGCDYEGNIALNHAVQLVGYGTDDTLGDYWLVRNSWGSGWGEDGYIRMKRESNPQCGWDSTTEAHVCVGGPGASGFQVCGMCGLLTETSYPLGAKLM